MKSLKLFLLLKCLKINRTIEIWNEYQIARMGLIGTDGANFGKRYLFKMVDFFANFLYFKVPPFSMKNCQIFMYIY